MNTEEHIPFLNVTYRRNQFLIIILYRLTPKLYQENKIAIFLEFLFAENHKIHVLVSVLLVR